MLVKGFTDEFARYRSTGERAMAQVPDEALNRILSLDGNSIAMLARHVGGNLVSRFTDFLTTDGEKPWRDRDGEFAEGEYSRTEIEGTWTAAWDLLASQLAGLTDDDLERIVTIRGVEFTVHEALLRSLAHAAMHVGQIVLLARVLASGDWQWLTIPKGQSREYNRSPTLERGVAR